LIAAFEKQREGGEEERAGSDEEKHLASSGAQGIQRD
jgi:hypothetical protein